VETRVAVAAKPTRTGAERFVLVTNPSRLLAFGVRRLEAGRIAERCRPAPVARLRIYGSRDLGRSGELALIVFLAGCVNSEPCFACEGANVGLVFCEDIHIPI